MVEFRRSLAASFLFRFFADTAAALEADAREDGGGYLAASAGLPEGHASAAVRFERPASRGVQIHGKPGEAAIVGAPVRHLAADLQVHNALTTATLVVQLRRVFHITQASHHPPWERHVAR